MLFQKGQNDLYSRPPRLSYIFICQNGKQNGLSMINVDKRSIKKKKYLSKIHSISKNRKTWALSSKVTLEQTEAVIFLL